MDINDIVSLIGSLGFPIVCCIMMWRLIVKTMEDVKTAITNNTIVMKEMSAKLSDIADEKKGD